MRIISISKPSSHCKNSPSCGGLCTVSRGPTSSTALTLTQNIDAMCHTTLQALQNRRRPCASPAGLRRAREPAQGVCLCCCRCYDVAALGRALRWVVWWGWGGWATAGPATTATRGQGPAGTSAHGQPSRATQAQSGLTSRATRQYARVCSAWRTVLTFRTGGDLSHSRQHKGSLGSSSHCPGRHWRCLGRSTVQDTPYRQCRNSRCSPSLRVPRWQCPSTICGETHKQVGGATETQAGNTASNIWELARF